MHPKSTEILRRDSQYLASPAEIKIRRKRVSGKTTIDIDPKGADGYVAIEATIDSDDQDRVNAAGALKERKNNPDATETDEASGKRNAYSLLATGIDLNFDGEYGR